MELLSHALLSCVLSLSAGYGPPRAALVNALQAVSQQGSPPTRAEQLVEERRRQLAGMEAKKPSRLVGILATGENRGFDTFTSFQLEHFRFGFGQISPASSLTPAIEYARPRFGNTPLRLTAAGAISVTGFQVYNFRLGLFEQPAPYDFLGDAFLGAPFEFDQRSQAPRELFLYTDLRYRNFPRENYYGLGQDSLQENRSDYSLKEAAVELVAGYQFTRWMGLVARGGLVTSEVGPGNDDGIPDTVDVFDEDTAPGLLGRKDYLHLDWALYLSWKADPNQPSVEIGLRYGRYDEVNGTRFDYNRFSLDARGNLPLGSRQRNLAARFYTSGDLVDPGGGSEVPFYQTKWIGGAETLRGFRNFRFRDTNLIYLSTEYRWEATAGIELAVFYDTGKVYPDKDEFNFDDLDSTWGGGVRVKNFRRVSIRLDVGTGREGTRFFFAFGPSF